MLHSKEDSLACKGVIRLVRRGSSNKVQRTKLEGGPTWRALDFLKTTRLELSDRCNQTDSASLTCASERRYREPGSDK